MTLLGFLRSLPSSPASIEDAQTALPAGLIQTYSTPAFNIRKASTELLTLSQRQSTDEPRVFRSRPWGRRLKGHRQLFATVAALYKEGYQPFVPGLVPPEDPEMEVTLSLKPLIEAVEANERGYQEDVSRWLVATSCYQDLMTFREDNRGFFDNSYPLSPKQAMEGVAIINKWWPWIQAIEEAQDRHIAYLDWKALGADKLRF